MKKIYLISLLSILSLNLYCQQENEMVLDSTYGYYWDSAINDWALHGECTFPWGRCGWARIKYSYDANMNLIEETRYSWDNWYSETDDWTPNNRDVYIYDANRNLIEHTFNWFGSWDSETNDWNGVAFREDFTYDASGNLTEMIRYHWDDDPDDWMITERKVFTYDSTGNLTEAICFRWRGNDWMNQDREVFTYDASGNQTEMIRYRWDDDPDDWIITEREVFIYDASRNLTEKISYYVQYIPMKISSREVFTYDSTGNLIEKIVYEGDPGYYFRKEVSYWSQLTTSYPTKSYELNFKIFPNPTTNLLTIETELSGQHIIEITSLNGQLLFSDKVEGPSHQIDLSSFENGLYFITVRSRDYVRTEKIIKQ